MSDRLFPSLQRFTKLRLITITWNLPVQAVVNVSLNVSISARSLSENADIYYYAKHPVYTELDEPNERILPRVPLPAVKLVILNPLPNAAIPKLP